MIRLHLLRCMCAYNKFSVQCNLPRKQAQSNSLLEFFCATPSRIPSPPSYNPAPEDPIIEHSSQIFVVCVVFEIDLSKSQAFCCMVHLVVQTCIEVKGWDGKKAKSCPFQRPQWRKYRC